MLILQKDQSGTSLNVLKTLQNGKITTNENNDREKPRINSCVLSISIYAGFQLQSDSRITDVCLSPKPPKQHKISHSTLPTTHTTTHTITTHTQTFTTSHQHHTTFIHINKSPSSSFDFTSFMLFSFLLVHRFTLVWWYAII